MVKGVIVKKYLNKFPNSTSASLSRKIYNENQKYFGSIEDTRRIVRYYRGASGKIDRKRISTKKFFKYNLPKSGAKKQQIFQIPENRILIISDLHIPYQDNQAIETTLDYAKKQNINAIIINGDLIDFFMISRFDKLERKYSVAEELDMAKQFLQVLKDEFNVPIYFLMGNHDNRLEHYLAFKAPELLDVDEFKLEKLLEVDKFNVKIFKDTTILKTGKLNILHGHLLLRGIFAPVNPARGSFMKAKSSVLIGHTHKVSTHSETTLNGKNIVCYSTGCLSELNPDYQPYANNYTHGFAYVETKPNGHYKVRNLQILNGEIIN